MNNLKFRVWDKTLKIFLPSEYKHTQDYSSPPPAPLVSIQGELFNWSRQHWGMDNELVENPGNYIISQFIGIQDKNGIDLFEGDKINFEICGIPHGPEREYIEGAEIWYSEEDCMWCFGRFKTVGNYDYWYSFADNIDRKTIEKVGCIYE